jgi:hypothetical protein
VTENTPLSSHRRHVYYEEIPPRSEELTLLPRKLLGCAILFSLLAVFGIVAFMATENKKPGDGFSILFWSVPAALFWICFFLGRSSVLIFMQGPGLIVLFADRPSREAVDAFVKQLFKFRNLHLRAKYGQFSPDEPLAERLRRLELLRGQEAITEEEYQSMSRKQKSGALESQGPIGFGT